MLVYGAGMTSAEAERAKAAAEAAQALDTALREAAARHEAAMRELLDAKEVEQRAAAAVEQAAAERRARSSHTEWMEGTMKERRAAQHAALTAALNAKVRLQLLDHLRCCPIFCLAVLSIAALASPHSLNFTAFPFAVVTGRAVRSTARFRATTARHGSSRGSSTSSC